MPYPLLLGTSCAALYLAVDVCDRGPQSNETDSALLIIYLQSLENLSGVRMALKLEVNCTV